MSPSLPHRLRNQLVAGLLSVCATAPANAFLLSFSSSDFGTTPTFSNVQNFTFAIEIGEALEHRAYVNPIITGVDYSVSGSLAAGTPSTFPAFLLNRPENGNPPFPGTEFYAQGSSLQFEIAAAADLTDGLQVSDLTILSDFTLPSLFNPDPLLSSITGATNPVLVFNGREIQNTTGFSRFHPALFVLNSDGSGSIRNSNNVVNLNGFTEIPFNSEYVTELSFNPATTTLSTDTAQNVPAPASFALLGIGLMLLRRLRLRSHPRIR